MYNFSEDITEINSRLTRSEISFKNKKILITGGAGFLGSWVCDILISQGASVICIDNLSSGLEENIKHLKKNPNFMFINHDISIPIHFGKIIPTEINYPAIKHIDFVMHMASRASPFEFKTYPIEILKTNTYGTVNSLEIAREHNSIFFFSSTSETYGNPPPSAIPTPETYFGNVNPIGPRSCYDESKRCGETFLKAYESKYNLNVKFVRIFNTYGPRIRGGSDFGRVVPNFIQQSLNDDPITVFGDGKQTRCFIYVVDEIEGILKDTIISKAKGIPINLGSNIVCTVVELAEMIIRMTNSKSKIIYEPLPKDDPILRQPELTRAKNILNWQVTTDLEKGLKKTIEWFKDSKNIK